MSQLHDRNHENMLSPEANVSATLVASAAGRLRGVHYIAGATQGSLIFKDGGSSGTIILTLNTEASATSSGYIEIPGGGIPFSTDLYVAVSVALGVTAFYTPPSQN